MAWPEWNEPARHVPPRRPVQLVLVGREAELAAKLVDALEGDSLVDAIPVADRAECAGVAGAGLGAALRELAAILAEDDPEWLAARLAGAESLLIRSAPASVWEATVRALHRRVARTAERRGQDLVLGVPVGVHWYRGSEHGWARAALVRSAAAGHAAGASLLFLGNLDWRADDVDGAREHYRRAFALDPGGVAPAWLDAIEDEAVASLLDEAGELGLEPTATWVPLVGHAAGIFALPAAPEGQGDCRDFHAALLAARRSRDPVPHRRRMKELAPALFARLRDAGRL